MKIVKGILAVIAGIIGGSMINAGIIILCNAMFGTPEGMDIFDAESVKAHADKLSTANYIGTLLAHQMGTLVGAIIAAKIAPARKLWFAFGIGAWFLFGGMYAASLIPAPIWFLIADFALYIPSAYAGGKFGAGKNTTTNTTI